MVVPMKIFPSTDDAVSVPPRLISKAAASAPPEVPAPMSVMDWAVIWPLDTSALPTCVPAVISTPSGLPGAVVNTASRAAISATWPVTLMLPDEAIFWPTAIKFVPEMLEPSWRLIGFVVAPLSG